MLVLSLIKRFVPLKVISQFGNSPNVTHTYAQCTKNEENRAITIKTFITYIISN